MERTNFVEIFKTWSKQTPTPTVRDFLGWLGDNCKTTAGQVMTDTEFQHICELAGASPEESEDALMESAWP